MYDTVERLHKRGLVDVQQSEPREYRAVSKETAFGKLRQDYNSSIETADAALEQVESAKTQEEKGTWAIANADHVSDRLEELLDDAEEHVHLIIADETILRRDILARLAATSDRGVTVLVEVPSERTRECVQQAVPDAQIAVSGSLQETHKVVKKWPGQLMMVDNQAVLASGVEESELLGVGEETAVWSPGHNHGFAAWMRELLADRRGRYDSSH